MNERMMYVAHEYYTVFLKIYIYGGAVQLFPFFGRDGIKHCCSWNTSMWHRDLHVRDVASLAHLNGATRLLISELLILHVVVDDRLEKLDNQHGRI